MCEFLSLGLIDTILSFVIFIMNIVYTVWGWFIPNDPNRTEFNEHMEKLKSYLNFVTYSDSLVLPIKIIIIVLIQYVLCKKKGQSPELRESAQGLESVHENDNENVEPVGGKDGLPALSTSGANVVHENVNGFPNFLKMNVSRKKNIVEV